MSQADDPEVQKNGFRVMLEEIGVAPRAVDDFFEQSFDESASFMENVGNFRDHMGRVEGFLGNEEEVAEALDQLEG